MSFLHRSNIYIYIYSIGLERKLTLIWFFSFFSREPLGVKGVRQSVVITNNPCSIEQNQQLLVRFPNLGKDDVIVLGTARLAFTITLASEDANRTVVQNLGRAIVKKLTIKISGNEVISIDNSDVFHCYNDLWKTASERGQMVIIRGLMPLITEIRRGFESVPETEIQALPLTTPSQMPSVVASSYLTSSCSRATCHFTRVHWAICFSMSSRLTTTAV